MIQKSPGSGNQQVDTLGQLLDLCFPIGTSDDNAVRLGMVLHKFARHAKNLQRQFARRRHDNDASAVSWFEAQCTEDLDGGDEKRECLAGTSLGGTENILSC